MSTKIDLQDLKRKPILHIAEMLGMQLVKTGSGVYAMKDPEQPRDPSSLIIFEGTNTWKRFSGKEQGGVSGGSTIDLCMHVRECDFKEAVNYMKNL